MELLQATFEHKFSDSLKLEIRADVLDGDKDSFWGKWRRNDRLAVSLFYYF